MLGLKVELQLTNRKSISSKKDRSLGLFICLGCAFGETYWTEVVLPSSFFYPRFFTETNFQQSSILVSMAFVYWLVK